MSSLLPHPPDRFWFGFGSFISILYFVSRMMQTVVWILNLVVLDRKFTWFDVEGQDDCDWSLFL